jgi:hypothetical protein
LTMATLLYITRFGRDQLVAALVPAHSRKSTRAGVRQLIEVWSNSCRPIFAEKGKPWKGFAAIGNINERRRSETAPRENETRLAAEKHRLPKLIELSSVGERFEFRVRHSPSL